MRRETETGREKLEGEKEEKKVNKRIRKKRKRKWNEGGNRMRMERKSKSGVQGEKKK